MTWSIEEEDAWLAALWENVVINCATLPSVHVFHQYGHVQCLCQGYDMDVVTFFGHWLHLLQNTFNISPKASLNICLFSRVLC